MSPPEQGAASAARRATGDPGLFLIPEAHLPPGFAEKVEASGWEPVAPRPAATVALLREAPGGTEALLLRRHRRSGFAADAWVFPGGRVDAGDRDPALAPLLEGPSPGAWAGRLGVRDPAEALSYVAAALREAWEETGIVLAPECPAGERLEEARRALLAEELTLAEAAAREGIRFHTQDLLYVAHWITPEPEPRRFDTRFFLARVHADAECAHHEEELTEARWMPPAEAVERFRKGEMTMLPPTVHTLRRIAEYASLEELWSALRDAPVPAILPRMRRHPEGVMIELPAGG